MAIYRGTYGEATRDATANDIAANALNASNSAAAAAASAAAAAASATIAGNAAADTEIVADNIGVVTAVGNDLNGAAITLDYGDLGAVNNPAYPTGVLGAIYDVLDEIQLVAAVDEEISVVASNIDEITNIADVAAQVTTVVNTVEQARDDAFAAQSAAETAATSATSSASAASTSATNASNSASSASTSATNAATSASSASTSASAASTSASSASISASNASTSETNAAASASAAAASAASAAAGATFENLSANGDIGTGSDQVAAGDHLHTGVYQPYDVDTTTATNTQTLTNKTLSGVIINDGYTEEVFNVTGTTPALSPNDGSIQTWTLTGASTPTAGTWDAGQSITMVIDDGTAYTINWASLPVAWKSDGGTAPVLNTTGETVVVLFKVGSTIYGARVGDS